MSFVMQKLYLYKHPILGSTSLTFCNDEILKSNNEIYNTVIIGANGIGKSYILKAIIEIFNFIHLRLSDSNDSNNLPYKFELTYYINGDKCVLSSMPKDMEVVGRGEQYNVYHYFNDKQTPLLDCKLPIRLIASSMTINDKFKAKSDDFYRYNGIRNENSPNTTGTRTLVRKTVNSIISCISYKNKFREELKCLLSKLGLQEKMTISYGMRHKEVFLKSNITPDLLSDIFNNREKYFPLRETDIWGKTFFLKVKEQPDKIKIITDFLSRVATKNYKRKRYVLEYDIIDNDQIIQDAEAIDLLSKLDILTFPSIKVYKDYENYNFMDSSSGETNLLCQFIGILSAIQEDSLVIIDEPENSAHPNWQINYIGWLKEIFSQYNSCHFVLATHSHFILTDLQENNSTIIALEKSNGKLENIAENLNTFCWSVDDILYNVFHVRNTRNYAFETDIYKLLNLESRGLINTPLARDLVVKLSRYTLPGNDPLKVILEKIQKSC